MSYYDLWSVLQSWKREFTTGEFTSTFASPDPNKVLHDMRKKGLLERLGWGHYRVNSSEEYLSRVIDIPEAYDLVKNAGMDYSLTEADSVFLWTKGGYQVDRFFGFYPIHIKVKESELNEWNMYFTSHRCKVHVDGERVKETLFGIFYVLHPQREFSTEEVDGFSVDPLNEAVAFCKEKIYSYEPALEMLNELYDLGLKVEYREERTNI